MGNPAIGLISKLRMVVEVRIFENLGHHLSTTISQQSPDEFEIRFRKKLAKGCSSVTKGPGSLLKAVKRSKSRTAICF